MLRTNKYRLPFFLDGDLYSASVDRQRAVALDTILYGLASVSGDGVISGLEISDLGLLNIKVSQGDAFISGYYSRNFSDTFLTMVDDQENFLYALRDVNEITDGESEASNRVTISFLDFDAPILPVWLTPIPDEKKITVKWAPNTEDDISSYFLEGKLISDISYQDLVSYTIGESINGEYVFDHIGLESLSTYEYRVKAIDTSGNASPYAIMLVDTLQDLTPPADVSNLKIYSSDSQLSCTWNHSVDIDNDVDRYIVIINEIDISDNIISADEFDAGKSLTYAFADLKNDTTYRIYVKAIDSYSNLSTGISATSQPKTQGGIKDVENIIIESINTASPDPVNPQLQISWDIVDTIPFSHYNIYIIDKDGRKSIPVNSGKLNSRNMTFYALEEVLGASTFTVNKSFKEDTDYTIIITTVSNTGSESTGTYHKVSIDKFSSPSPVSQLLALAGDSSINLSWERPDNSDFDHYELFVWKTLDEPLISESVSYQYYIDDELFLNDPTALAYSEGGFIELDNLPLSGGVPIPLFFKNSTALGVSSIVADKFIPKYYDRPSDNKPSHIGMTLIDAPTPEILSDVVKYTIEGLDNGEEYQISLMIVNTNGLRSFPLRIPATPDIIEIVPSNPINVSSNSDNARVNINWVSGGLVDGYNVYRAGPLPFGREVGRISQFAIYASIDDYEQLSMVDFDVEDGLKYAYIVVGTFGDAEGELDVLQQTVVEAFEVDVVDAPLNLTASSTSGSILLDWVNPGDISIEGWNIYRSNSEFYGFEKVITLPTSITSFTDVALVHNVEYFYYVTSFSSTLDIISSLSSEPPINAIALGSVLTASGDIINISSDSSIISGLKNKIEEYTTEFLKRHLHEVGLDKYFDEGRSQSIKINLSNDGEYFNFTTEDYRVFQSPFQLEEGRIYTAYLNGEITNLFFQIDSENDTVSFEEQLYNPDGGGIYANEPVLTLVVSGEKEVSGVLNQNLIGPLAAGLLNSGILPIAILPEMSHEGRIREDAGVSTFKIGTTDGISFNLNTVKYLDPDGSVSISSVGVDGETVEVETPIDLTLKIGSPTVFYSIDRVDTRMIGGTNRGLLLSDDNGIVWNDFLGTDTPIKFLYTSDYNIDGGLRYAIGHRKAYISRDGYQTFQKFLGLNAVTSIHGYAEGHDFSMYLATDVGLMIMDIEDISTLTFRTSNYIKNGTVTTDTLSVFINSDGYPVISNAEGVFVTEDNGESWSTISSVTYLYKMQRYNDGSLIAVNGEDKFLYRSYDEGVNWERQLFTRGISNVDILKVVEDRVFYTKEDGVYYTEDFDTYTRIDGEMNSFLKETNAQLIYGITKSDVSIFFENYNYKYYNDEMFLWSQFSGIAPVLYKNGKVIKNGYYYNSDFNVIDFEHPLVVGEDYQIATIFDSYELPAKGWQDIDEDDVVVEMYIDGEPLKGVITVENDDGSTETVEVDSISSTEVVEYVEYEDPIPGESAGTVPIESTRNKVYIFKYENFTIHVNSKNGSVVFFTGESSDNTGDKTSTDNLLGGVTPSSSNSLNKFNLIQVSVINVSFINEGTTSHLDLQDAFSKVDLGFNYDLGNTYVDAILQMGLSIEHAYLENATAGYPYAFFGGARSFNSELINSDFFLFGRKQYDVFNSTVDYLNVGKNDKFIPGVFRVNFFKELFNRTWLFTDSNIFALDSFRNVIEEEIFIEEGRHLDATGLAEYNNTLYVVASGSLYGSDDEGNSWYYINTFGVSGKIRNVLIINNIMAIGTSESVYYTNVGTESWKKANYTDSLGNIVPISGDVRYVLNSALGYIVVNNILYRTPNGVSWEQITDFNSVSLSHGDPTTLTVSGIFKYKNLILIGTDQGLFHDGNSLDTLSPSVNYTLINIDPLDSEVPIKNVSSSDNTVTVTADRDSVYRSFDSGRTWDKVVVDEIPVVDLVHIWSGVVLTSESQDRLVLRSVPPSVVDKLDPIVGIVYAEVADLDNDIQSLLNNTEYSNFGDTILDEGGKTTEETELASFLHNIYERNSLGEFTYLLAVGSYRAVFGRVLDQPISFTGTFDKVSLYLGANNFNNENFSLKLSVFGGDSLGNVISSELSFDIKNSADMMADSWYNFRVNYSESYDTVVLRLTQISGGDDKTIEWKLCQNDSQINAYIDGVEQSFSFTYNLWEYENAVNPIDQLLLSKSANQVIIEPELGDGIYDKTILDDGKIKLTADEKVLSFIIDQSGSQNWNDHDRDRFRMVRKMAGDLHALYPGDLSYTVTTYGGQILSDFIIDRIDEEDDRFGKFFRVVRNDDHYPLDPFDGIIVTDTTLSVVSDDTVEPGFTYYYSIFNIRESGSYSEAYQTKITSNKKVIPLSMGVVKYSIEIIEELVDVPVSGGGPSSSLSSSSSDLDGFASSSSSSLNSSSSSLSSINSSSSMSSVSSSESSDSSVSESYTSSSSLSYLNSSSSSNAEERLKDTGKRLVSLEFQPISDYLLFYSEVRIVRKRIDSDDIAFISNISDGEVLYEGIFEAGINLFIDDYNGNGDFPNGVTFVYAFFTKNDLSITSEFPHNYCTADNANQQVVNIPSMSDSSDGGADGNDNSLAISLGGIPLDPIDLTIEAGNQQNRILWNYPEEDSELDGVVGFVLYSSTDGTPTGGQDESSGGSGDDGDDGGTKELYRGVDTSFVHRDLENEKTQFYRVVSFNTLGVFSDGDTIGQATSSKDRVDDFEPPRARNFTSSIINSERILLNWSITETSLPSISYFDDFFYVRSAAFDKYGSPISKIDEFSIDIISTSTILQQSTEAGTHIRPSGLSTIPDLYYAFAFDNSTYNFEIRAQLELVATSSTLNNFQAMSFELNSNLKIADEDQSKAVGEDGQINSFELESTPFTAVFEQPLKVGVNNSNPDSKFVVKPTEKFSEGVGCVPAFHDVNGVYIRSGTSYEGYVAITFEGEAIEVGDFSDLSVDIDIYEVTKIEYDKDCNEIRFYSDSRSNIITAVDYQLTNFENKEVSSSSNEYISGNITVKETSQQEGGGDGESSDVLMTVASFKLLPSDTPRDVMVVATVEYNGYVIRSESYVRYNTILNMDLTALAPIADGVDIASQFASVYLGPPSEDSNSTIPRVPVRNGIPVKWELLIGNFGKKDRAFFTTESITTADGIYSATSAGVASNVFFGPASDVEVNQCFEDRIPFPCGEFYKIRATVILDGLVTSVEADVEISPLDNDGEFRFFMTNGGEMGGITIWGDGIDESEFIMYGDSQSSEAQLAGSTKFNECLENLGLRTIILNEGQELSISGYQPLTFLEKISLAIEAALSGDEIPTSFDPEDIANSTISSNEVVVYEYEGIEYSDSSDLPLVITSGVASVKYRVNKFVGPPPIEKGGSDIPGMNDCYGVTSPSSYPPRVVISGRTSSIIDGNAIRMIGGGDQPKGTPPVFMTILEPLDISFVSMMSNGDTVALPLNDGKSETELIFNVSFRGEPVPEGVIVKFDIALGVPSEEGEVESVNPFAEIDKLSEEARRILLGGFSDSKEMIDSVKLINEATTTRTIDGVSTVSAFISPTLIPKALQLTVTAATTYDELGTVERIMTASGVLTFLGLDDNKGAFLDAVERFDPDTGVWTQIDSVNTARGGAFSHYNPANNKLYIGGGLSAQGMIGDVESFAYYRSDKEPVGFEESTSSSSSSSSDSLASSSSLSSSGNPPPTDDSATYGEWVKERGRMNAPRAYVQSAIYNKNLIKDSSTSSDNYSSTSSMTSGDSSLSSASSDSSSIQESNNRIYVMGGYGVDFSTIGGGLASTSTCEYYDIDNDDWVRIADMPIRLSHGRAEILGDYIYLFSGLTDVSSSGGPESYNYKVLRYDIINDRWNIILSLNNNIANKVLLERISPQSYIIGTKIYITGGIVGDFDVAESAVDSNIWRSSIIEMDMSDDSNITLNELLFSDVIIDRFRHGGSYLDGKYYAYAGSGTKEHEMSQVTKRYSSNTLRALEIFDTNTDTWETYKNLQGCIFDRYNHGSVNDGEYIYAISGASSGYPANKLFVNMTASPDSMRADGIQNVAITAELRKTTGEPPEDGIKVQVRGYVVLPTSLYEGGETVSVDGVESPLANVSSSTTISDVVNAETSAIENLGNKVSIYPVKMSSTEGPIFDGSVSFIMYERGEDVLSKLADLLQFIEGDDDIVGLEFDENGAIKLPKEEPVIIKKDAVRNLYSIIVEGTIDDDYYFGQSDTVGAIADHQTKPGDKPYDDGFGETSLVNSAISPQEPSVDISIFSDLMWFPSSFVDDDIMQYEELLDTISFIEQDPPFGGSPHWDAIVDNATEILKTDSILGVDKIIIDVADSEDNLSTNTLEEALQSIHSIDGYIKTPIFMNAFVVDFPPSLAAKAGSSSSSDLEYLSRETLGLSHNILDPSFVVPVVNRMKTDAVGSIGRGSYIQVVDLGESVLVDSIGNSFDVSAFSKGGISIEYGSDGYNYESIDNVFKSNTVVEISIKLRFLRFTVFLETTYGDPDSLTYYPPPVFNSITISYTDPIRQYIYTYPIDINFPVREIFITSNATMVPECSSVKIGISHSNSSNWFDYASKYQPPINERGRIVVVNRNLSTLDLEVVEEGGNTIDSPKSYDQITQEFMLDQTIIFSKNVIKIIVVEEHTLAYDGQTLLVFEDRSQELVDSAPDYSEASDSADFKGQNPTFNVTSGTVFNYDFLKTENGYEYLSTYGAWQPGSLVNVYINDVLINKSEYLSFSHLGLIKFNSVQNYEKSIALETVLPPQFRLGIEIENGDYRTNIVLDEFAYMFSQDILSGISRTNSPPQVTNLVVSPADASIYSTYTASYRYYDVKNEPERGSIIQWYLNDNLANELTNKLTWSNSDLVGKRLKDGDRIYFTVQPSDGVLFGATTISGKVVIGITPPRVEAVQFVYFRSLVVVAESSAETEVVLSYEYIDDLGRPETGTTVQWFLNGDPLDVGSIDSIQIKPGQTGIIQSQEGAGENVVILQRGNTLSATVTPSNGLVDGTPVSTDTIVVQNALPSIQNILISPDNPSTVSVLSFTYNFVDADNDDDSSIYEWYKNGTQETSLQGSTTVPTTFLNSGDKWYVKVTPFDGTDRGSPVISSTITIR